ncbi:DUF2269 family protein [Lysinibacillus sp. CTST325]
MSIYVWFKYIHIMAAIIMVGTTITNGLAKMLSDRTGNVHRIASAMTFTMYFNKILMFPSLVVLAISGIGLTAILHRSLLEGWIFQSVIMLMALFALFGIGLRYERRLHRIALHSEENKWREVPSDYWKWSKISIPIGFLAMVVILLTLYLMVAQRSLFYFL